MALGAVSASALLAACSDSGSDTKPPATAETKPAEETKPAAEATPAAEEAKPADAPKVEVPQPEGEVDVAKLMEPGPLPDEVLGKADAKVTIVEYASMTCPHCAHFSKTTMPELKTKYIDTGKVRYILREFPFDPRAEAGFMLARCAGDNYFPMVEVLFQQQEGWATAQNGKEALLQIAKLAGFSQQKFEECLTNQKLLDDIRTVKNKGANDFGVDSTPTFFINGKRYKGAMSIAEISAVIDPLL